MADFPWSLGSVLATLRARLLGEGAVTAGATVLQVRAMLPGEPGSADGTGEHVVVLLRWQQDPCVYAIAVALRPDGAEQGRSAPPGVSTGLPMTSPEDWGIEVSWLLAEELDTGLVRRATRIRVGDITFLAPGDGADVVPEGYDIGELHLGASSGALEHITGLGLDVTTVRRLLDQGRLLSWLHASVGSRSGEPTVGHAAVARPATSSDSTWSTPARLEVLEVVPGTPATVAAALAYNAVRNAVEAGATVVTSDLDDPVLDDVGFHRERGGGTRSLAWRDIQTPEVSRRATRPGTA